MKESYITVRCSESTKAALKSLAEKEKVTLSYLANKIFTSYVMNEHFSDLSRNKSDDNDDLIDLSIYLDAIDILNTSQIDLSDYDD